jgi:hypothetical protein
VDTDVDISRRGFLGRLAAIAGGAAAVSVVGLPAAAGAAAKLSAPPNPRGTIEGGVLILGADSAIHDCHLKNVRVEATGGRVTLANSLIELDQPIGTGSAVTISGRDSKVINNLIRA